MWALLTTGPMSGSCENHLLLPTCEEIGTPVNARVRLANAIGIEPIFTVLEAVRVPDPSTYWDVSPSVQSRFGATVLP